MSFPNTYPFESTDVNKIPSIVKELKTTFDSNITLTREWRLEQLSRLLRLMKENREKIAEAMYHDLHRSSIEANSMEFTYIMGDCQHAIEHLDEWMQPKKVATSIINQPGTSYVRPEPLGVTLIMAPWNYPVALLFQPLVGALAAGNTALLRPSQTSPHTSECLARLVTDYFDPSVVAIVKGDPPVTTALLQEKFDFIFFTGGRTLGTAVAEAAAKTLTPVSLELGGKSPCIIMEDADIYVSARRITWAAFANAGQTCVRPDYGLIHESLVDAFINTMIASMKSFYSYGDDLTELALKDKYDAQTLRGKQDTAAKLAAKPHDKLSSADLTAISDYMKESPYLARLISTDAYDRILDILQHDKKYIKFGGNYDPATRYIQPTILYFPDYATFKNSAAMQAEIFGPIFPIVGIQTLDQALQHIRANDKPLALYGFTGRNDYKERILNETSSGALVFNDCIVQLANEELPFGGVGGSGTGRYHGKYSFDTFSHEKAVLYKGYWFDADLRYPPYTKNKQRMLSAVQSDMSWLRIHWAPATAAACAAAYYALPYVLPKTIQWLSSLNNFVGR